MDNDQIVPVKHGVLSGTSAVVGAAAGGYFTGFGKWFGRALIAGAVIGAAIAFAVGIAPIVAAAGALIASGGAATTATIAGVTGVAVNLSSLGASVMGLFGSMATWGAVGLIPGAILGIGTGAVGAVVNPFFAGAHAAEKVKLERSSYDVMQAQVSALQAQAAIANAPANDNKYNLPACGSRFNEAGSTINASSVQLDSTLGQGAALAKA